MGKRGPLHQRGLTRRKSRQKAIDEATTVGHVDIEAEAPFEPGEHWAPMAISMYEAVQRSGQAEFYTESDWAKLYLLCDQLSSNLQPQFVGFAKGIEVVTVNGVEESHWVQKPVAGIVPMNGATLNALQSLMASLGISEGDRRRMNIELVRAKQSTEDEAAKRAREDAQMMEQMATGNVVPIDRGRASGDA
jgi:hypothetical protein